MVLGPGPVAGPFGNPLCASPALPGAVHDIKAARSHGILDALATADVHCWVDKGCFGVGAPARVRYRGRPCTDASLAADAHLAPEIAPGGLIRAKSERINKQLSFLQALVGPSDRAVDAEMRAA